MGLSMNWVIKRHVLLYYLFADRVTTLDGRGRNVIAHSKGTCTNCVRTTAVAEND